MAENKTNSKLFFLLVGALLLYIGLRPDTENRTEVRRIVVELRKDIISVSGKGSVDYRFWTKEYTNQFNVLKGSISKGRHKEVSNLKAGQRMDLLISTSAYSNLNKEDENIIVRGIAVNEKSLLTEEEFYHNRTMYKMRTSIFITFFGAMLFVNGLFTLPQKLNYLIVGAFIATIILLRIFEVGIY